MKDPTVSHRALTYYFGFDKFIPPCLHPHLDLHEGDGLRPEAPSVVAVHILLDLPLVVRRRQSRRLLRRRLKETAIYKAESLISALGYVHKGHPPPFCLPYLELIYSVESTQPPFICLLLYQPSA